MQIFIPESVSTAVANTHKRLKWALKYTPKIVCFDESNISLEPAGQTPYQRNREHNELTFEDVPLTVCVDNYQLRKVLLYAHKLGRKVHFATW